MKHYYVFYTNKSNNFYERTCGTQESAEERVKELKKMHENATYFEENIPKGYKWFY